MGTVVMLRFGVSSKKSLGGLLLCMGEENFLVKLVGSLYMETNYCYDHAIGERKFHKSVFQ